MRAFNVSQQPFETGQRPGADAHAVADGEERAGLVPNAGGDETLDGKDLAFVNRRWNAVETDDLNDAGGLENR